MRRGEADVRFAQRDQFTGGSRGVGSALVRRIEFADEFRGKPIRRAHISARKRLHEVHQRTRPSAAITAHAFAGASALSQIGGLSGARNGT
jgi:hypothetical protein